ncbi:sialic acid-binding Ig-like lectin 14 [Notamacropus eugenii]|uniref:sialic acid-binding Ig-like lectin 14 n=1 Tax=Notamacropus eugenii TaxID=9315 RepID=UPI003B66DB38
MQSHSRACLCPVSSMLLLLLLLPLLWEGSLSQRLNIQHSVTVQEGMCAHILCTTEDNSTSPHGHSTVYGYWYKNNLFYDSLMATNHPYDRVEKDAQGRFHLLGDPRMTNCSLSITDAQSSDKGMYFFYLKTGHGTYIYLQPQHYVNVTGRMLLSWEALRPQKRLRGSMVVLERTLELPPKEGDSNPRPNSSLQTMSYCLSPGSLKVIQKPDICIPEVLESGNPVTLNCTLSWACGDKRPFKFSWIGAPLSSKSQSSGPSHSSQFSLIPGHEPHDTNLTCQVTLPGGRLSTKRTVQLNVSCECWGRRPAFPKFSVFVSGNSSALVVQEGESLHLPCAANSNPPATLSWILGDQTLISSQPSEDGVLPLDLPHLGPADGGNYICLAQHPLGSKQASLRVSVQYSPRIISSSCFWLKEGLFCTCAEHPEPDPSLLCWVEGKPVEGSNSSDTFQITSTKSGSWTNSSLRVKVDRVPNNTISCEGKKPQGTHTLLFQLVLASSAQENSSWPLVLTLLKGTLMGAGFLLTCGLTGLYYTRKPIGREQLPAPETAQSSL